MPESVFRFVVLMEQLETAELFFDIGADRNHPDNPAGVTLSRTPDDAERVVVDINLPQVAHDTAVVVRVEAAYGSTMLRSQKFIHVAADSGIEADPQLNLTPASQILTGTLLQVEAAPASEIADFSADSYVSVSGTPQADSVQILPMEQTHRIRVSSISAPVNVDAVLKDRSGHERKVSSSIARMPYLQGDEAGFYGAPSVSSKITDLAWLDGQLIWSENSTDSSFILRSRTQVITEGSGLMSSLFTSGHRLVAEIHHNGDRYLSSWLYQSATGNWQQTLNQHQLQGSLIGLSGDLAFLRYGNTVTALSLADQQPVLVAGVSLNAPVNSATVSHDLLQLVTSEEIGFYRLTVDGLPQLTLDHAIDLAGYQGATVMSAGTLVWKEGELGWLAKGEATDQLAKHAINGQVTQVAKDGDILWVQIQQDNHSQWLAWRNGEIIGLLDGSRQLLFSAGQVFRLSDQSAADQITVESYSYF